MEISLDVLRLILLGLFFKFSYLLKLTMLHKYFSFDDLVIYFKLRLNDLACPLDSGNY